MSHIRIAAGGIVIRCNPYGIRQLLVIHQTSHNGWGFPKGHVDPGESLMETALREVEEETGVMATILRELPTTNYTFFGRKGEPVKKTVHWFLMKYLANGNQSHPHEVHTVEWLPLDRTYTQLTYENDRELLTTAEPFIRNFTCP